ncbi:hypothetical protein AB0M36_16030 [Actinoplanes sp. NPDC051346]|uniref:hypothetical protein n=1 Tax=Actinoplanes sp. NPDC051346 TaxID=3155048 RepID=UPI00341C104D
MERAELLSTFQHTRLLLRMYMAAHMQEAIDDAVRHPLDVDIDFWPRFMGWIPQVRSVPPTEIADDFELAIDMGVRRS